MTDKENLDNWKHCFTMKPDVGYPGKINIDEYDCLNDNKIIEWLNWLIMKGELRQYPANIDLYIYREFVVFLLEERNKLLDEIKIACDEVEALKAENTELRERLEKAVELPAWQKDVEAVSLFYHDKEDNMRYKLHMYHNDVNELVEEQKDEQT